MEEFCGDWDDYKAALAERTLPAEKPQREKNEYVLSKERRSAMARAEGALKRAEAAVAEGENAMQALEERLSAPENAGDIDAIGKLCAEIEALRQELDARYAAWERAEQTYMDLTESEDNA